MYEGSWSLFTKSRYLLNRGLLNQGLGVFSISKLGELHSRDYNITTLLIYIMYFKTGCYIIGHDLKKGTDIRRLISTISFEFSLMSFPNVDTI